MHVCMHGAISVHTQRRPICVQHVPTEPIDLFVQGWDVLVHAFLRAQSAVRCANALLSRTSCCSRGGRLAAPSECRCFGRRSAAEFAEPGPAVLVLKMQSIFEFEPHEISDQIRR